MNKGELVGAVADKAGLDRKQAGQAIEATWRRSPTPSPAARR
jgi:nucleoid DNA-binding protein